MNEQNRVEVVSQGGKYALHTHIADGQDTWQFFSKETEARVAENIIARRLDAPCPDVSISVADFADLYVEHHLLPVCVLSTMRTRVYELRNHILPFFDGVKLAEVDAAMVKRFVETLSENMPNRSVNRRLAALSAMLTKAVHWRYLAENPAFAVDMLSN